MAEHEDGRSISDPVPMEYQGDGRAAIMMLADDDT